jgi:hypothetical protein
LRILRRNATTPHAASSAADGSGTPTGIVVRYALAAPPSQTSDALGLSRKMLRVPSFFQFQAPDVFETVLKLRANESAKLS